MKYNVYSRGITVNKVICRKLYNTSGLSAPIATEISCFRNAMPLIKCEWKNSMNYKND